MRGRKSASLAAVLVALLAVAGTAANLFLLRLTQDSSDPVGRLSPRAVFSTPETTSPAPAPPPVTTTVVTTTGEHQGADD